MLKPEHRALLTPTELTIATLHEWGAGTRAIAKHLGLTTTTVRDHLERAAARIAALDHQEDPQ